MQIFIRNIITFTQSHQNHKKASEREKERRKNFSAKMVCLLEAIANCFDYPYTSLCILKGEGSEFPRDKNYLSSLNADEVENNDLKYKKKENQMISISTSAKTFTQFSGT